MLKDGSNDIKLWNLSATISNGTKNWTRNDNPHRRKTENKWEKLEYYTGL